MSVTAILRQVSEAATLFFGRYWAVFEVLQIWSNYRTAWRMSLSSIQQAEGWRDMANYVEVANLEQLPPGGGTGSRLITFFDQTGLLTSPNIRVHPCKSRTLA